MTGPWGTSTAAGWAAAPPPASDRSNSDPARGPAWPPAATGPPAALTLRNSRPHGAPTRTPDPHPTRPTCPPCAQSPEGQAQPSLPPFPPACSAPFGSVLDYSQFSLVVHVEDTSGWVSTAVHRRQAAQWTSEAGPPTHTIADVSQLLPTLRGISPERVARMQAALQRVRRAFLWKSVLSPEQPAAADVALSLVLPSYQLDDSELLL